MHFSYNGMVLRSILAILDHNANLNRNKACDVAQYSKASKSGILKSRKEAKSDLWRDDLMIAIYDNVVNQLLKLLNIQNFQFLKTLLLYSDPQWKS